MAHKLITIKLLHTSLKCFHLTLPNYVESLQHFHAKGENAKAKINTIFFFYWPIDASKEKNMLEYNLFSFRVLYQARIEYNSHEFITKIFNM